MGIVCAPCDFLAYCVTHRNAICEQTGIILTILLLRAIVKMTINLVLNGQDNRAVAMIGTICCSERVILREFTPIAGRELIYKAFGVIRLGEETHEKNVRVR